MMPRLLIKSVALTSFFLTACIPAAQADSKSGHTFCTIAGYLYGSESTFSADLAVRIAYKSGAMGDPTCMAAWKEAHDAGQYIRQYGKYRSDTDREISNQATEFKNKVQDSIIEIVFGESN